MEKEIIKKNKKCIFCQKEFMSEEYIQDKGMLKGYKVVQMFCSNKCRIDFKKSIDKQ